MTKKIKSKELSSTKGANTHRKLIHNIQHSPLQSVLPYVEYDPPTCQKKSLNILPGYVLL